VTENTDNPLGPIKCPDGWLSYSGHCYMIHREPKVWKEALTSCKNQDGNLASMHNIAENSFIVSQLGYSKYFSTVLSAVFIMNRLWLWLDKTAVDFVNWNKGQPSSNQFEYCVEMSASSGYWNTIPCSSQKESICKKPKSK
uniref:C-type lectin domain-containing protein n=1 Tax=Gopherus evgoodei TaxID=1825980 RepID=A0A8C4W967_9SAUR